MIIPIILITVIILCSTYFLDWKGMCELVAVIAFVAGFIAYAGGLM